MAETVLPVLLDKTSAVDLNTCHGSVLAIAEILHALSIVAEQSDCAIQDVVGKLLFLAHKTRNVREHLFNWVF